MGAVLDSGVKCGEYSVIGEKAHIASEAVIEKGVGIWSGKNVEEGARLYENVKRSSDSRLVIDENGECSLWGGEATVAKGYAFWTVCRKRRKKREKYSDSLWL